MKYLFTSLFLMLFTGSILAEKIDIPVNFKTLDNGLKVMIVPDTNVAVVSCRLYYFVGGMNEGPGTSGLSHMYEHMMFKGTKTLGTTDYAQEKPILDKIDSLDVLLQKVRLEKGEDDSLYQTYRKEIFSLLEKQRTFIKKDEIWDIYMNNGGTSLNAWTGKDMTAYIVTLPRNKVELFYWIESDRMQNPVLREFPSEQDVVMEERRMRYDNRPLNRYWERLNALFYVAHPYRQPVIGWESDIKAFTTKKLMEHINQYYTPDNALIVLVGNVNPEQALQDIQKYFGQIPPAKKKQPQVVTREPAPIGETRFTVEADVEPRVDVIFHTPGFPDNELYALDIVEGILSGRTGRLYKRLVDEEKLCTATDASNDFQLHAGNFHISAQLKSGVDHKKVEAIIKEELEKVYKEPPSEQEMLRIKNEIRMSFAEGLKSLEGLSDRLAWFERLGSWKYLLEYPDKINSIDKKTIPQIAAKYLKPELATWGAIVQKSEVPQMQGVKEERNSSDEG